MKLKIKCDQCGEYITIGSKIYTDNIHIALYCSVECLAFGQMDFRIYSLTEDIIKEHRCTTY